MPHFWYKKTYTADGLTVDAFYIDTMAAMTAQGLFFHDGWQSTTMDR